MAQILPGTFVSITDPLRSEVPLFATPELNDFSSTIFIPDVGIVVAVKDSVVYCVFGSKSGWTGTVFLRRED